MSVTTKYSSKPIFLNLCKMNDQLDVWESHIMRFNLLKINVRLFAKYRWTHPYFLNNFKINVQVVIEGNSVLIFKIWFHRLMDDVCVFYKYFYHIISFEDVWNECLEGFWNVYTYNLNKQILSVKLSSWLFQSSTLTHENSLETGMVF